MIKTPSARLLRLSKFVSIFFNPMNSLVIYFLLFSIKNSTLREATQQFVPLVLLTALPISGWLFWQVRKGAYTDADVSDREQRKSLYFVIGALLIIYLVFTYLRTTHVDLVVLFLLILLVVLQASNYFIKSSMHTAFNVFVSALMWTVHPLPALIWLGITLIVAVSRLVLRRHTLAEIMSGAGIATVVATVYLITYTDKL